MGTAHRALHSAGLAPYWEVPRKAANEGKEAWQERVHEAVASNSDANWAASMDDMVSTESYRNIKHWGANTAPYSFSKGEEGRCGRLVSEKIPG